MSVLVIFFTMAVAIALGFALGSWRERARGVQSRLAETVGPAGLPDTLPTRADASTRRAARNKTGTVEELSMQFNAIAGLRPRTPAHTPRPANDRGEP